MQLKDYQQRAVQELLGDSKRLLSQAGSKKLIFKAPTGSGKTIVMAEFLKQFVNDREVRTSLAFIWAAPRKLHEQSKDKLERYFENSRALECSYFEDLTDRQIQENEILFFNWESIRQEGNVYIRDNEQENNLSAVLERTRDAGCEVVLVIDESHYHAQAETSQNLMGVIVPKLTIEVSATPVMQNPDELVSVPLEEVKAEGMIKKSVLLNPDFENVLRGEKIASELASSTDEIVLREAVKKREELTRAYREAGVAINPLLLIQLPDRRAQTDDDLQARIERILKDKHGVSVGNGKLAIYLSENKENLENLTRNDNEAQVLMFKQAIALGWDCPRAQVLALFREWASPVFSIQTIGRIMRMPEPDKGHHENDLLNHAYVYTNIDDIEIKEDIGRDYVTIYTSRRIAAYKPVRLVSVHRKRHREKTRLSSLFINLFLDEARKYGLEQRVNTKDQQVHPAFIADWEAENVDMLAGKHLEANVQLDVASPVDLQRLFDFFVQKNLSPFYPEDRSVGRVKEAIYYFCRMQLGLDYTEQFEETVNLVLSEENHRHFLNVLATTKERYVAETQRQDAELEEIEKWEVPEQLAFGGDYVRFDSKKSVMQSFYYDARWRTEKAFIEFLEDRRNGVLWWFKNGENERRHFAVLRTDGVLFYPDFIVQFEDGRIGIFDTKAGMTARDAKERAEGLQRYIREQNKKDRNIWGGIVIYRDGSFWYNDSEEYTFDENVLPSGWKVLNFEQVGGEVLPISIIIVPIQQAKPFVSHLPVFTLAAAAGKFGAGQDISEEGWVQVNGRRLDEKMFVARVVGHSMEPKIPDGSYCIFRANPVGTRQGKIVLVQHRGVEDPETGGQFTVKRYTSAKSSNPDGTWRHTKITLEPLNPAYQPIRIDPSDAEAVTVLAEFLEVLVGKAEAAYRPA